MRSGAGSNPSTPSFRDASRRQLEYFTSRCQTLTTQQPRNNDDAQDLFVLLKWRELALDCSPLTVSNKREVEVSKGDACRVVRNAVTHRRRIPTPCTAVHGWFLRELSRTNSYGAVLRHSPLFLFVRPREPISSSSIFGFSTSRFIGTKPVIRVHRKTLENNQWN